MQKYIDSENITKIYFKNLLFLGYDYKSDN